MAAIRDILRRGEDTLPNLAARMERNVAATQRALRAHADPRTPRQRQFVRTLQTNLRGWQRELAAVRRVQREG